MLEWSSLELLRKGLVEELEDITSEDLVMVVTVVLGSPKFERHFSVELVVMISLYVARPKRRMETICEGRPQSATRQS